MVSLGRSGYEHPIPSGRIVLNATGFRQILINGRRGWNSMSSDDQVSRRGLFDKIRNLAKTSNDPVAQDQEDPDEIEFIPAPFDLAGMLERLETGGDARVGAPAIPMLRPPGALPERAFLDTCTRCGECIAACPHDAIILAPERFRSAAGSPMLSPLDSPCRMCVDTPCISACAPQALRLTPPKSPFRMGVAHIKTSDCLAHQGSFCSVCVERCPIEGAITVTAGKPKIQARLCTGCGICHHMCPSPWNAILVMPELERT